MHFRLNYQSFWDGFSYVWYVRMVYSYFVTGRDHTRSAMHRMIYYDIADELKNGVSVIVVPDAWISDEHN